MMAPESPSPPEISVVIPAYLSERTVGDCLESLRRQTFRGFETILVDSGPTDGVEQVMRHFPEVRYVRSSERLLPHGARNLGIGLARGQLLAFLDPDIYAAPDWLERLVRAQRDSGGAVAGGLACHGDRWLDQGIHLTKFSKWLPGGQSRPVDNAPTANLAVTRELFDAVGGFSRDEMLGDALFTWQARERASLWLEPGAVAEHHHLSRFGEFLRERYVRGRMFGNLRANWRRLGRLGSLGFLLMTVLPVRLPRILVLVALQCRRAGQLGRFAATFPIIALGHAASLAGEAATYWRRLTAGR